MTTSDTDRARSALWALDPGMDRTEWVRIGCAAKAAGLSFEDFNDWSETAPNYGGIKDTRTTWGSFKLDVSGGVNAGSLFHYARQAGWNAPAIEPEPKPRRSRTKPRAVWDQGAPATAEHAYIQKKGGTPDGLRLVNWPLKGWAKFKGQSLEGWLMVPVLNPAGDLVSVQFIGPGGSAEKLNAPGAPMEGTFTVGEIQKGTRAAVVEGIGHAWSIQAVTGCAAVVSFGSSNTERAAAAIQAAGAQPVIVPDRGKEDQAREIAARLGCAVALLPANLEEGADINDLHQVQGPDAVREVLKAETLPAAANTDQPVDVHQLPPVGFMDWPHLSEKQQPLNTIPNLKHLLNHYGFTVRYDVIRKDLAIRYPGQSGTPDNQHQAALNTVLSLCSLNRLPKAEAPAFLVSVGDQNPVNPVMDWILSEPWDGISRLEALANTLETRPDYDRDLLALLLRRWLVSAVAAAAKPEGFKSKGVLTLQGEQSLGKTAWFMNLVPSEQRDLLKVDAIIDPKDKDTITSAVSHWLVELGELDGTFRKSDIARLKGFISADYDQFRRPYARTEERYPRKTVFFASVNDSSFLVDDTGNTRWWTVPVSRVNYDHKINTQQLWAEVYELFKDGENWWLDRDEERRLEAVNDGHRHADPVEDLILSRYNLSELALRRMTATEVLIEIGFDRPTNAQCQKAGKVLAKHFGASSRNKGRTVYTVPPLIGETPL